MKTMSYIYFSDIAKSLQLLPDMAAMIVQEVLKLEIKTLNLSTWKRHLRHLTG